MITEKKLLEVIHSALEQWVEEYNKDNKAEVTVELEGDSVVVDGGTEHGTYEVFIEAVE